jgi:small subunit ribosomal protein S4
VSWFVVIATFAIRRTNGRKPLIEVNDHTVNIPSYRCKPQDFITIKDQQKSQAIITRSMDYSRGYKTPNHLTLDSSQKKGSVNQIIDRESIDLKIN